MKFSQLLKTLQIKSIKIRFVSFITTHGDRGKIYGSDSEYLDIKEVTDAFKTTKCPYLAGKPKLFIIVASGVRQNFTGGSILPAVGLTDPTATLATGSADPNTPVRGVTTDAPARCEPAPMIGLTNAVKPGGGGDDDDYDNMNDSIFREKFDPDEPHFLIAISLAPGKLKLNPGPVSCYCILCHVHAETVLRKSTNVPEKSLFLSLAYKPKKIFIICYWTTSRWPHCAFF
jgi:hypothetical protein